MRACSIRLKKDVAAFRPRECLDKLTQDKFTTQHRVDRLLSVDAQAHSHTYKLFKTNHYKRLVGLICLHVSAFVFRQISDKLIILGLEDARKLIRPLIV